MVMVGSESVFVEIIVHEFQVGRECRKRPGMGWPCVCDVTCWKIESVKWFDEKCTLALELRVVWDWDVGEVPIGHVFRIMHEIMPEIDRKKQTLTWRDLRIRGSSCQRQALKRKTITIKVIRCPMFLSELALDNVISMVMPTRDAKDTDEHEHFGRSSRLRYVLSSSEDRFGWSAYLWD